MVDTRKVKIYVLKHPDTLEIRYVGKTVAKLSKRLSNHIINAKVTKHNKHLSNWILKILEEGKKPIIELIEECENSVWQEREKYWIAQFDNLVNITIGGDGAEGLVHSQESIEKMRKANLGKKHTQEFKDAMSKRLKGVALTQEHKDRIGIANRGRKASEDTKKKLSDSHKGYKATDEAKKNLSEAIKAWWAKRKSSEDIVSTK